MKVKRISVMRSAPYVYTVGESDLYTSFDLVATGKLDPDLDKTKIKEFALQIRKRFPGQVLVMSAPEKRSIQTAQIIGGKILINKLLSDVSYRMENFISRSRFYDEQGVPRVDDARKQFVEALVTNETQEKYVSVIGRIEKILAIISKRKESEIILISHGFIMKIMEAYLRDPLIKAQPSNLKTYFSGESETFKFGEGFIMEEIDGRFYFVSYIRNQIGLC